MWSSWTDRWRECRRSWERTDRLLSGCWRHCENALLSGSVISVILGLCNLFVCDFFKELAEYRIGYQRGLYHWNGCKQRRFFLITRTLIIVRIFSVKLMSNGAVLHNSTGGALCSGGNCFSCGFNSSGLYIRCSNSSNLTVAVYAT